MPKLVIVSPSLKLGGIERALTVLTHEFAKKAIEVHFISCLKGEHFYQLPENVEIHEPAFYRTSSLLNKIEYYPRLLNYIRKTVKAIHPDRILVFGDWFSPITLLALKGLKYSVFISDRTIPDYTFKFPIPQFKKWLYPGSAGFIAQTTEARNFKDKIFKKKLNIKVIPNALPSLKLDKEKIFCRELSILYVGRFAWEKDPEILIRSFSTVVSKNPDWKLKMAGSGPLLQPMKKLVRELNLDENVFFLGQVKDIAAEYKTASIFVLPSVVEGFPNALIEAMSFGLPCICFSDIPHQDIIENQQNGIVIENRSKKNLSEEILSLIEDPGKRLVLSKNAIKVKETYCSKIIAKEYLCFLEMNF